MYTEIAQPDCIDNDYLGEVWENLKYFKDCTKQNSKQFKCNQINESETGSVNGETCIVLQEEGLFFNEDTAGIPEQKFLIMRLSFESVYSISDSENASEGQIQTSRTYTVKCNGVVVKSLTSTFINEFYCVPGAKVELCINTTSTHPKTPFVPGTLTATVCGVLSCMAETENSDVAGFFLPEFKPECQYGRDAIHLISRNLAALRDALSEFGQIPSCATEEYADAENHVLFSSATTVTEFLVIGNVSVIAQNRFADSAVAITLEPKISCNGQALDCMGQTFSLPGNGGESGGTPTSFSTIAIACGTCLPGQSLNVELSTREDCNTAPSRVVSSGGAIISARQEYCVYKFERNISDFGDDLAQSLGRCITTSDLEPIHQTMTLLQTACESQVPVDLDSVEADGIAGVGTVVLQEAATWPPATPPARPVPDPAPIKKRYITAKAVICMPAVTGINAEELTIVEGSMMLMCGDVVLKSSTTRWTHTSSGFVQRCSSVKFSGCVECAIDKPLTLVFDSQGINTAASPDSFDYEFKSFCF